MSDKEKIFSVVIPTCGRDESLALTLFSLQKQDDNLIYEVIIVADGATLPTVADSNAHFPVKLLATGKQMGPAYARNLGAKTASGSVLVFVDDDIRLAPDALTCMAKDFFSATGSLAVTGHVVPDCSLPQNVYMSFAYSGAVHSKPAVKDNRIYLHYCTSFAAIDRSSFEALAGFDERFSESGYEDVEFAYRAMQANIPLLFVDKAIAYHGKQMDREWFIKRCKSTGKKLHLFHDIQPDACRWYHKILFNRVSRFVAGVLARIMISRIKNLESSSLNLSWLRITHAFWIISTYC